MLGRWSVAELRDGSVVGHFPRRRLVVWTVSIVIASIASSSHIHLRIFFFIPMRADRYCGFGPWTQHRLYSINTALGELIIVVYVVLKILTLLFTTPMTNFIFDIY